MRTSRTKRKQRTRTGRGLYRGLHKFEVEKPFCTPCRLLVHQLASKYEIPIQHYKEDVRFLSIKEVAKRLQVELRTFENLKYGPFASGFLPMACWASFYVPEQRAGWFEDLINYQAKLVIVKGSIDPKSYERGQKRAGNLPKAWKDNPNYKGSRGMGGIQNKPPVDSKCSEGKKVWASVEQAIIESRQP